MTKNQLEALKFAREISEAGGDYYNFWLMAYIVKIASLEPDSVSIHRGILKKDEPDLLFYDHPWEAELDRYEGGELDREYARLGCEKSIFQVGSPDYWDQENAARWVKVSRKTIQRWGKEGLRSFAVGKRRLYLKRDVLDFKAWHPGNR